MFNVQASDATGMQSNVVLSLFVSIWPGITAEILGASSANETVGRSEDKGKMKSRLESCIICQLRDPCTMIDIGQGDKQTQPRVPPEYMQQRPTDLAVCGWRPTLQASRII